MDLTIEERTRNQEKDALLANEAQQFLDYLVRVRKTVELPYANSLAWRIGDAQDVLARLIEECSPNTGD